MKVLDAVLRTAGADDLCGQTVCYHLFIRLSEASFSILTWPTERRVSTVAHIRQQPFSFVTKIDPVKQAVGCGDSFSVLWKQSRDLNLSSS